MATTSKTPPRSHNPTTSKGGPHFKPQPKETATPVALHLTHANALAVNFAIPTKVIESSIPKSLMLDHYKGDSFISLVCMEIKSLPIIGMPIVPKFCELSLRTFVRERNQPDRMGVYYVKSFVSSTFGAWVLGNSLPHTYQQLPIKPNHTTAAADQPPQIDYQWKIEGSQNKIRIRGRDRIKRTQPNSKLEFILSHSTRYLTQQATTFSYQVTRPEWILWDAAQANFTCDVRRLFGKQYVKPLAARPVSAFVSPGSKVKLHKPVEVQ